MAKKSVRDEIIRSSPENMKRNDFFILNQAFVFLTVFRKKLRWPYLNVCARILQYSLQYQSDISFSRMSLKIFLAFTALLAFANTMTLHSHEGRYAWYTFNERPTGNRCTDANQCDGQRQCSPQQWCKGTSRPAKNADYKYDEAVTGNTCPRLITDKNYANRDYFCDGKRTCSATGWCQGTSRP